MFGKKRENILNYRSKIQKAIKYLEESKQSYIAEVYQAFAFGDKESIRIASKAVAELMCGMTSVQIMRLDEEFRQYTSMEWMIDWSQIMPLSFKKMIRNREEYLWVVRLGTFHPNGYFREKCIRELEEDEASLPYLFFAIK